MQNSEAVLSASQVRGPREKRAHGPAEQVKFVTEGHEEDKRGGSWLEHEALEQVPPQEDGHRGTGTPSTRSFRGFLSRLRFRCREGGVEDSTV
ncbi:hypothetical protein TGPRC2_295130 [Toxoplasma gondii TgCatPRC2]|uniref:Uncharacterized protein n=12 Tax=Toxoplasma gondii TaxID=5811 RepID=A0A125YPG3_TOXGV|nr:hypothetical protein TGME49_295130 [Toxoplasma gondii ME49]EPR57765.1 hypothetical protein TGGT1_295130 [Toxoplasma gondii GT1]ESS29139.1 hypothetical protein TGVEG_295130 [Toxoplasma gondii VEG]KFG28410.1 hypothetical protein TGP89_295130 [Toxoplasma gondii p89]KFG36044.1 hypothetical protein TGFOU_295130 [Toxoplasma gondii FOU]KFG37256.1 hypothetical protein TGDOM2_295130 [Toxoplasma gondii GAB2-2007-GAL-DOM2]KFH05895.1 hypothetical protein TGMAS_295130 [Toxoplasma gondii MAS]KYF39029.1|eukprot:XP_018638550.1 hypothetical protein TGME49_295130 [Toxoplasma gondii ME49]